MLITISVAEGAAMISHNDNVAFNGFTPNAVTKAVICEVTKKAVRLREVGEPF